MKHNRETNPSLFTGWLLPATRPPSYPLRLYPPHYNFTVSLRLHHFIHSLNQCRSRSRDAGRSRSKSRSPDRDRSRSRAHKEGRDPSPRSRSRGRSRSRSRSRSPAGAGAVGEETRFKTFIGGIPNDWTEGDMEAHFRAFHPTKVQIQKDKFNGRSRGFGFAWFADDRSMRVRFQKMFDNLSYSKFTPVFVNNSVL